MRVTWMVESCGHQRGEVVDIEDDHPKLSSWLAAGVAVIQADEHTTKSTRKRWKRGDGEDHDTSGA